VSARKIADGDPSRDRRFLGGSAGDDELRREIVTPEGVPLSLSLAERGDRAAAFLLDAFIIALVIVALALLAFFGSGGTMDGGGGGWTASFVMIALFGVRNFYFAAFEIRWRGQTPGKRALRIRVIDRHGGPLTTDMVVARNLMREIEVFLPLGVLLAPEQLWPAAPPWARLLATVWVLVLALIPFFNRDRLRIGDLVAGTMVVRSPRVLLMPDIGGQVAEQARRAETRYQFTSEQLEVYGIYELQVLENVLRADSQGMARQQSIDVVSEKIRTKIRWPRDAWNVDAEIFLREFYAALRAHLERKMLFGKRQEDKYAKK
jgi:uncharacterized RDD family membrane protein YckC